MLGVFEDKLPKILLVAVASPPVTSFMMLLKVEGLLKGLLGAGEEAAAAPCVPVPAEKKLFVIGVVVGVTSLLPPPNGNGVELVAAGVVAG